MKEFVGVEKYMTAKSSELYDENCRDIRIESFLDEKSTLPVPPLAEESNQYPCKDITIEGMGFKKSMFWCMNKVVKVLDSDSTDQVAGFFMSSGRAKNTLDKVYIFKSSETNDKEVVPWAKLDDVDLLENAYYRYKMKL